MPLIKRVRSKTQGPTPQNPVLFMANFTNLLNCKFISQDCDKVNAKKKHQSPTHQPGTTNSPTWNHQLTNLEPLLIAGLNPTKLFEPRKNPPTFHYTGWLIGILIMVYYNLYIQGGPLPVISGVISPINGLING